MLGDGACYIVIQSNFISCFSKYPHLLRDQFLCSSVEAFPFSHLYSLMLMQTIISVSLSQHFDWIVFINYIDYPIKCCEQFWSRHVISPDFCFLRSARPSSGGIDQVARPCNPCGRYICVSRLAHLEYFIIAHV